MTPDRPGVLFGAAYYLEYQPERRLDDDLALMTAAGFNYVRVGESTWHLWEPADGEFRFDWIDDVVDRCHAAGLSVIIGTPTYAVPAWLVRRHPEILAEPATGAPLHFGGRQNVDHTHSAYRYHAERVIRAVVGRFAGHPAVIGFQVDNETGVHLLHNRGVRQRFADHLKARYGDVTALNRAWGTDHWSLGLDDWADLWPADQNSSPGYALDWRRFQAGLTVEFLSWQAGLVRSLARPDQFVTHCAVGGHELIRPAGHARAVARVVDVPGVNVYYSTQETLELPGPGIPPQAPHWSVGTGVWAVYLQADLARVSAAGNRFLVLETNASNAGYPHENHPPFAGQLRQAALALLARGAGGVGYWHWHSCHAGKEIYWRGVLGHDHRPGQTYREIAALGAEIRDLAPLLARARPDADVAFLYSQDSKYALNFLPPLADPATGAADPASYERVFDTFYRAWFAAGRQLACADLDDDLSRWPVLVVPAGYVLDDAAARHLTGYAESGGHLILTPRTGYADEHGRARHVPSPLTEAAGVSYQEYSNLRAPVPLKPLGGKPLSATAPTATAWADLLTVTTADPILGYDHPEWSRHAAVTTRRHGAGRITWIGTLPDPELARELARRSGPAIAGEWSGLPDTVRVDSTVLPDDRRLWFVGNWSGEPVAVRLPRPLTDPRTGETFSVGDELKLGARDTAVLLDTSVTH